MQEAKATDMLADQEIWEWHEDWKLFPHTETNFCPF